MCGSWFICSYVFLSSSLSLNSIYIYICVCVCMYVAWICGFTGNYISKCILMFVDINSSFGMIHQGWSRVCKLERRSNRGKLLCCVLLFAVQQKKFNNNAIAGLSTSDLLSSQTAVLQTTWTRQHSTGHIHPFRSNNGWVFGKIVCLQKLDGEIMQTWTS